MKLQVLVSAVNRDREELIESMNLKADAIIINQTDVHGYTQLNKNGFTYDCYDFVEKGVGLSRNNALLRADADIVLFSDEDITYEDDFAGKVIEAFEDNPSADMLLFNFNVCESRRTYWIQKKHRVRIHNSGRYPTYSFAIRLDKLRKSRVMYSLLFGGGAKYSNGEDSLFIRDLIHKGFRIYALPICLGSEAERESSWFSGYTEKFFFDRGVLYHFLYGQLAGLMGFVFWMRKKSFMCKQVEPKRALRLIKDGIKEGRG